MATESNPEVKEGALGSEAIIVEFLSDELITMWAPVILVGAASGENPEAVEPIDSVADVDVIGVAVGPLRKSNATADYASTVKGELVKVCTFGRCKVKVDGNAANIAIGDALVTHNADGVAQKADFSSSANDVTNINAAIKALAAVFAIALKASTADGDIIPCFVNKVGGDTS